MVNGGDGSKRDFGQSASVKILAIYHLTLDWLLSTLQPSSDSHHEELTFCLISVNLSVHAPTFKSMMVGLGGKVRKGASEGQGRSQTSVALSLVFMEDLLPRRIP